MFLQFNIQQFIQTEKVNNVDSKDRINFYKESRVPTNKRI